MWQGDTINQGNEAKNSVCARGVGVGGAKVKEKWPNSQ